MYVFGLLGKSRYASRVHPCNGYIRQITPILCHQKEMMARNIWHVRKRVRRPNCFPEEVFSCRDIVPRHYFTRISPAVVGPLYFVVGLVLVVDFVFHVHAIQRRVSASVDFVLASSVDPRSFRVFFSSQ